MGAHFLIPSFPSINIPLLWSSETEKTSNNIINQNRLKVYSFRHIYSKKFMSLIKRVNKFVKIREISVKNHKCILIQKMQLKGNYIPL